MVLKSPTQNAPQGPRAAALAVPRRLGPRCPHAARASFFDVRPRCADAPALPRRCVRALSPARGAHLLLHLQAFAVASRIS